MVGYSIQNEWKGEDQDVTRARRARRDKCRFETRLSPNGLPNFKSAPKSKFGKSAVFEIGTFNLAGAGFKTGATEQALTE